MAEETRGDFEQIRDFSGFFAIDSGRVVTVSDNTPLDGWVTLSFTEEGDMIGLNAQMFYVPAPLFRNTAIKYLSDCGYVVSEPED